MILDEVQLKAKSLHPLAALPAVLEQKEIEILLTLGAGDIDTKVEPIAALLERGQRK